MVKPLPDEDGPRRSRDLAQQPLEAALHRAR